MKIFKPILTTLILGLLMIFSCSKESKEGVEDGISKETLSVKLNFSYVDEVPASKAPGPRLTSATSLSFETGHIFFIGADGVIYKHISIGTNHGGNRINKDELMAGSVIINDVSSHSTQCVILLNESAGRNNDREPLEKNLTGYHHTAIESYQYQVSSINDENGGVELAPLHGIGDLSFVYGEEAYQATVSIEVEAAVSRYQIGKISAAIYNYKDASDQNQTITINSFEVEAIYINNFYKLFTLNRGPAFISDNGMNVSLYTARENYGVYSPGYIGERLHDQINREVDGPSPVLFADENDESKVWAYNLFPTTDCIAHILVKFKNVKYTDSRFGVEQVVENQFITVEKLKFAPTHPNGGEEVTFLEPNNIYTINDLKFNYTHLASVPYQEKLAANVTVTIMNWLNNDVVWYD